MNTAYLQLYHLLVCFFVVELITQCILGFAHLVTELRTLKAVKCKCHTNSKYLFNICKPNTKVFFTYLKDKPNKMITNQQIITLSHHLTNSFSSALSFKTHKFTQQRTHYKAIARSCQKPKQNHQTRFQRNQLVPDES